MICEKCKHTIEQPLELYNGEWACPDCKAKLGGVMSDFEITADNEQLFKLAECCYHNWLEGASRGEAERVREQLEKAIEFTREAAAMGNPEAVVRLGYYYDKDYTEVNKSEAARCRAAYAYYSAVCYASSELKVAKEGVKGVYDFRAIRIKAAGYLLKMLASAPEELTSSDKFNYENNLAMIKERLGVEFPRPLVSGIKQSAVEQAFSKLMSCFARQNAPLFGVMRLSGGELKELKEKRVGSYTVIKLIRRGLFVAAAQAAEDSGKVSMDETFTALKNERGFNEYMDGEVMDGADYWLFFFNEKGGHRFFGKFALGRIQKALTSSRYDAVKTIIDGGAGEDLTFLDDDVYMCKSKIGTMNDAVKKLAEYVQNGGF